MQYKIPLVLLRAAAKEIPVELLNLCVGQLSLESDP